MALVSWTGQNILHRYLSNEGINTITEEEPCYPLPYRGHPSVRGVDHIRGSQCFINADLHNSATIPYQEAASKKPAASGSAAVPPPLPVTKQSTSLLGGWLARLRLLSHWLKRILLSLNLKVLAGKKSFMMSVRGLQQLWLKIQQFMENKLLSWKC